MFRYCIWYCIKKRSYLNAVAYNATLLNSFTFQPHITLKSDIKTYQEAKEQCDRFRTLHQRLDEKIVFSPKSPPITSCSKIITVVDTMDFHAIELPVALNGVPHKGLHISLAYRQTPVSAYEVACAYAANEILFEELTLEDLYLCVVDCSKKDPSSWKIVSKNEFN